MSNKSINSPEKKVNAKQSPLTAECKVLKKMLFSNMTYAQLAAKLGISENNLNFKINGKRRWWLDECVLTTQLLGFNDLKEVFPEIFEKYKNEVA